MSHFPEVIIQLISGIVIERYLPLEEILYIDFHPIHQKWRRWQREISRIYCRYGLKQLLLIPFSILTPSLVCHTCLWRSSPRATQSNGHGFTVPSWTLAWTSKVTNAAQHHSGNLRCWDSVPLSRATSTFVLGIPEWELTWLSKCIGQCQCALPCSSFLKDFSQLSQSRFLVTRCTAATKC